MSDLRVLGELLLWFGVGPFAYCYAIYQIADPESGLRRWLARKMRNSSAG